MAAERIFGLRGKIGNTYDEKTTTGLTRGIVVSVNRDFLGIACYYLFAVHPKN